MTQESTISVGGRTTIPRAIRKALNLKPGDCLLYTMEDGAVRIRPLRPISRLRGIVQHRGPPLSLQDLDRAIAEGAGEGVSPVPRDKRPAGEP